MLALELAGTALMELERYDEALERFEAVAAEAPSAPSALVGAGKAHLLRGEPSEALGVFARLLQARTGRDALDRWARAGRALALRRLGDPGAERAAERAIRGARDAPSYVERGTRLEFFGAFADAEDDFRMAIELEPEWGTGNHALALNLLERDARRDVATGKRQEIVGEARRLAVFVIEHQRRSSPAALSAHRRAGVSATGPQRRGAGAPARRGEAQSGSRRHPKRPGGRRTLTVSSETRVKKHRESACSSMSSDHARLRDPQPAQARPTGRRGHAQPRTVVAADSARRACRRCVEHLHRRGIDHVGLDADDRPGGASSTGGTRG